MGSALPSRFSTPEAVDRLPAHTPLRKRILFLSAAWLVVLLPFLFWRGVWFGRPLSDQQIETWLHDRDPRHVHHALIQIGQRMATKDALVVNWYPDLVELTTSPDEEVRATDAWAMSQDPAHAEFHQALTPLLRDGSPAVRLSAALALVRFSDASGHDRIVELLQPATLKAPRSGLVIDVAKPGASVRRFGPVAHIRSGENEYEMRAPWAGRVRSVEVKRGEQISAAAEVAVLQPSAEDIYDALRALSVIGRTEDLPAIDPYLRVSGDVPERVRQQAESTAKVIRDRSRKTTTD